jgi:hypothetical protein
MCKTIIAFIIWLLISLYGCITPVTTRTDYTNTFSGEIPPSLEQMILITAETKTPQRFTQGAVNYMTIYNYSDPSCHYVSLISWVDGFPRKRTLNYAACGGIVRSLGEEPDYFFGAPEDVKQKARQMAKSCSVYGGSSYQYNDFRIDCRVLNPSRPCLVEVTITREGRLIEKQTFNSCK